MERVKRMIHFHHAGDMTHDNLERELEAFANQAAAATATQPTAREVTAMPTLITLEPGERVLYVSDVYERIGNRIVKYPVTTVV